MFGQTCVYMHQSKPLKKHTNIAFIKPKEIEGESTKEHNVEEVNKQLFSTQQLDDLWNQYGHL